MCLRFVFLLITRVITWLRLSRREETWKTAEILLLRHQVTVPQRHQACRPKLNRADRALLATLPGVIPRLRRQRLRLLITPDTIVRCRRGILQRRWAARSMRGRPGRPATRRDIKALVPGWPAKTRMGVPQDPRGAGRAGSQGRSVHCMGDPQDQRNRPIPATGRAGLVTIPALPGRRDLASDFFTAGLLDGTQAHVLAVIEHTRPGASASSCPAPLRVITGAGVRVADGVVRA
jgi:putative transposase